MAHLAHYKEAHPLPFRITHWINLVCMVILIITGFAIHFPYWPYFESMARGLHVFCGFVIFINCIVRIIMAFFIKAAPTGGSREKKVDIVMWMPQADNKHQLLEWVKYYLFLRKSHPLGAKLGVPQKLSYLLIPILIIIMFITGISLWAPTQPAMMGLINLVGGVMSMRIIHYFLMYVFIIFCFIHIYLANVEGAEPTKLMFFGTEHEGLVYDPKKHDIIGYDDFSGEIKPIEAAEAAHAKKAKHAAEAPVAEAPVAEAPVEAPAAEAEPVDQGASWAAAFGAGDK